MDTKQNIVLMASSQSCNKAEDDCKFSSPCWVTCSNKDDNVELKLYKNLTTLSKKFGCLKKAFGDVLIVVTFNFPFYDNIPIIHQLYENVFGKVIYCGDKPTKGERHPDIEVDVGNGYFGYICMARAMEKYKGYKGYLYINDDMIVNWWNLLNRDKNKVWQGPEIVDFRQGAYEPIINKQWIWWDSHMGIAACQKSYKDFLILAKKGSKTIGAERSLKIYLKNGNGKPRCGKGWSDFFYVPGNLANIAQKLLEIYYENKLFLEMSVMNLLHSLDESKNFEVIKGVFLPDLWITNSKDSRQFWKIYSTKLTFIHPFKLGFEEYKEMNIAILKNWVGEITNELTSC
eukprot:gene14052-15513_t